MSNSLDITATILHSKKMPWTGESESPMESLLVRSAIEDAAYPVIFKRGEEYAQSAKVLELVLFKKKVVAVVSGSQGEAYTITLKASKTAESISGHCSCPFSQSSRDELFCKHLVAVALVAQSQYKRLREAMDLSKAMKPIATDTLPSKKMRL